MDPVKHMCAIAAYRWLLRLYPAAHRHTFGEEMTGVFAEALDEAARAGQWAALWRAGRELVQLPRLAALAHWQAWGERPAGTGASDMGRQAGMTRSFKVVVYGLLPLLLAILGWGITQFATAGGAIGMLTAAGAVMGALFAPALAWAARRLSAWVWLAGGLTVLTGLTLPGLASYNPGEDLAAASPLPGYPWWIPPVAIVTATMLLRNGMGGWGQTTDRGAAGRRIQWLCAGLGALLLARTVHHLYWLLVWDSTTDPLKWIWMVLPMLTALPAGAVLIATLPERRWAAAACAGLIPALLAVAYLMSQRVDFRQLTEQRATRATQAIEAYYAREGRYPATLGAARPWYAPPMTGPVIIYGQTWCYRAGPRFYQLGYVDRDHWSSPYLNGRLVSAAGEADGAPPVCEAEIAAILETCRICTLGPVQPGRRP